jgi:DNA-binding XRE family transcriptional regulator
MASETINNWENNHCEPKVSLAKKIIEFLGYMPFELSYGSLGQRLFGARLIAGLSHKKLGTIIKVDPKTIAQIEKDSCVPYQVTISKCERFIQDCNPMALKMKNP